MLDTVSIRGGIVYTLFRFFVKAQHSKIVLTHKIVSLKIVLMDSSLKIVWSMLLVCYQSPRNCYSIEGNNVVISVIHDDSLEGLFIQIIFQHIS